MPDLNQSLRNHDIGHLRIVAAAWGLELKAVDSEAAREELAQAMLVPQLAGEIVDSLPEGSRVALEALDKAGGKIPWAVFSRQFGEIREAGPGRRDRDQIYLDPISAGETLFYRGLIARAFFDTPSGLQEYAYIPEDLFALIRALVPETPGAAEAARSASIFQAGKPGNEPLGRPAGPREYENILPFCDRLVDDATTLLAALRMGCEPPETRIPSAQVAQFLAAAKIMVNGSPQVEPVRQFLESSREAALHELARAWRDSVDFNELRQLPGLVCEGEWGNQPLETRSFLLNLIRAIPGKQWWSLPAFVQGVKEKHPDYQRPAGDYDSWFIRRLVDGVYLRGFAHWEDVDGALIRYLITGPLYWLGIIELATPAGRTTITSFRIPGQNSHRAVREDSRLFVASQGKISVPRYFPRAVRYQISRFCEWDGEKESEYHYRVSTASLKGASAQGLKVPQLLSLLAKHTAAEIPPAFVKALKRWESRGTEARVEIQAVLRVGSPQVLAELRKTKAGRFLGESLGPVTAIIKPGAQGKVLAALAEIGVLAEEETGGPQAPAG